MLVMSIIQPQAAIFITKSKDYPPLSPYVKPGATFGRNGVFENIHFLLCESCYWCASQSINCNISDRIIGCPSCNSSKIESMPVSDGEIYRFDHDPKRGISLEFSRTLAIIDGS
jgi:hypothetical protein